MSKTSLQMKCLSNIDKFYHILVEDDQTFRIMSRQYGYVHHYGVYENLDILNFSTNAAAAAHFTFNTDGTIREMSTGKCVARLTATNFQLVLVDCNTGPYVDEWEYDSSNLLLRDVNIDWCWSPWGNTLPPIDIKILSGLSPCDDWNEVTLEYGRYFTFLEQ